MSGAYAVMTAFVQTPPSSVRRAVVSHVFSPHTPTGLNSVAASKVVASVAVKSAMNPATKSAALAFFNGIRVPATLIFGSSVVALFSMKEKMKDLGTLTKREILLMRVYLAVSILNVCLSAFTILTSTTAGTFLLLQKFEVANPNMDTYHFLKTVMEFEFVLTRWSFLTAQLLFLVSLTGRTMLEFELLTRRRLLPAIMTLATMGGMTTLMMSYVNTTLNCWPNWFGMTKQVGMVSCVCVCPFAPSLFLTVYILL
jgi:hypothetical protein